MDDLVCVDCGHVGPARVVTPGSMGVELLLWLCLLVPGLIYSAWRIHARRSVCAKCSGAKLLPLDTPKGRQLAADAGYVPPAVRPPKAVAVGAGRAVGAALASLLGRRRP
jgi:hypothetical protein